MTPSGIEPATFWVVAQCLNQLHHRVPLVWLLECLIKNNEMVLEKIIDPYNVLTGKETTWDS